jgi:hypothetical protein
MGFEAGGHGGAERLAVDGERAITLSPCASIRCERVSPLCAVGAKPPVARRIASHRMTDDTPTIYGLAAARACNRLTTRPETIADPAPGASPFLQEANLSHRRG